MTENEHLLVILMEECNEVAHRVSKALRFGLNEIQSGQAMTNAERISQEFADILAVYGMLQERALVPEPSPSEIFSKQVKVEEFMKYARELGTIK